jgi:hypothetical protein
VPAIEKRISRSIHISWCAATALGLLALLETSEYLKVFKRCGVAFDLAPCR